MPLLLVFAVTSLGCSLSASKGPVIVVTASFPGANAQVVADMIAAPIEQQINGVEGMARIESESRGDGSYVAYVRFRSGADPNLAMVQVQNRVALAQPILPEAVQKAGVTVKVAAAESGEKRRAAIALVDRDNHSREILRDASAAVLKRLSAERSMAAPQAFPGPDGKQLRIQINQTQQSSRATDLQSLVSNETDADMATSITQLSQTSTAYQAALASATKILQTSLLDYLK